jgi:hypothetical protein
MGADSDGSQNFLPDGSQCLDKCGGARTMKVMQFKSETAQRELSDLQRIPSAL